MATQIWVHVFTDDGTLYRRIPVASHEVADSVEHQWSNAGFDAVVVTCSDH